MVTVSLLGLGYIGLPTAAVLARAGHTVQGYDVKPKVVESVAAGVVAIDEPGLPELVREMVSTGRLTASTTLKPADVHVICVPTPFRPEDKTADLSYVVAAGRAVASVLRAGDLVVLESTVPVGTTSGVLRRILEESGLSAHGGFDLAHCPETILPGRMLDEIVNNPRIIGGETPEAAARTRDFYASFVEGSLTLTDARTAEFVKLAENAFRDVNIAFANEVAATARAMGVDPRHMISLANLHPRVKILNPGPGVGGHCVPVDPWFLITGDANVRLMRAAREVNDAVPLKLAEAVAGTLPPGAAILVLGLAYKGNVDDVRESPAFPLIDALRARGFDVRAHDPHVPVGAHGNVPLEDGIAGAALAVVVTEHAEFAHLDPERFAKAMATRRVLDTRGILPVERWQEAGFRVEVW